jgi:hypothetical protein
MKGGHVQVFATLPAVSVSDQAGAADRTATTPSTATWLRLTDISFTRAKNPARHRASNDYYSEDKAECHS